MFATARDLLLSVAKCGQPDVVDLDGYAPASLLVVVLSQDPDVGADIQNMGIPGPCSLLELFTTDG